MQLPADIINLRRNALQGLECSTPSAQAMPSEQAGVKGGCLCASVERNTSNRREVHGVRGWNSAHGRPLRPTANPRADPWARSVSTVVRTTLRNWPSCVDVMIVAAADHCLRLCLRKGSQDRVALIAPRASKHPRFGAGGGRSSLSHRTPRTRW